MIVTELNSAITSSTRVDRNAGVIRGVKVIGYYSANRRTYKPEALRRALSLYENSAVHVNHPPVGKETQTRGYEERIGTLTGVREGTDGLYGDLRYNPRHKLAQQLEWDAEHKSQKIGLSPVHFIHGNRQPDGQMIVESISRVFSVDLVTGPGTTATLFESYQPANDYQSAAAAITSEQFLSHILGQPLPATEDDQAAQFLDCICR